ncbi:MAG: T9SS type A sorting domain-containing protein [candidate division KSB1 bacterium]|nr:T9SS type A sorting domain-containing protein [candidate division KSB1 bacterium]MDZ7368765.1 T9SS type A sorting domain-containing protein [candidate division KSB1 bacterium]MDZ7406418.1 T9SS type A sorting domain-containing protein [candidate division KSB1 bacterium]
MPLSFELARNYPNPFNPSTMTKYELPQQVEVKLVIFDVLGRRVRTLVNQRQPAGRYTLTWDGRNEQGQVLASGVYIYQLPPVALCRHGAWRWCAESGSLE